MARIVVVGGGLGGLAAGFRLRQLLPAAGLTVLEAGGRAGGNLATADRRGFRVEAGPNGFLDGNPATLRLCRDLGLADRLIAASDGSRKNRFVLAGGRLHRLPGSPVGLLSTPLLSARGKLELLAEPFRRRPGDVPADETVGAFARRRFGPEAASLFVGALVTGIHAGDPDRLSVAAAFPRLVAYERSHRSVVRGFLAAADQRKKDAAARGEPPGPQRMWSFGGGLRVLVDALRDALGPAVVTGARAVRLERGPGGDGWVVAAADGRRWPADAVVLAVPGFAAAPLVADLDAGLSADLAAIRYVPVAVVALGYRSADVSGPQDGFGYLAPPREDRPVLGVQWCSSIFPGRAPPGFVLWRALCGGALRADVYALPDAELVAVCQAEMRAAMGVSGDPVFADVVRWPAAIPQYEVGHPARAARIDAACGRLGGVWVAGNAAHGVAMNDVTARAEAVAAAVADHLRPSAG